jgi:dCMP deaminase
MNRPSWDQYFLTIAKLTSERSNCIKRKVGCLVVKENRILSLGYNGTPRGTLNCFEGGCERCKNNSGSGTNLDLCLCLHAEENALFFVSKSDLQNSTMYVTLLPCISCTKKIIQCGIKRVVYISKYESVTTEMSCDYMTQNGITVSQLSID